MLFLITARLTPSSYIATIDLFKLGGAPPPADVKRTGMWLRVEGTGATAVCETEGPIALGKWSAEWAEFMTSECVPILATEDFVGMLSWSKLPIGGTCGESKS